MNNAEGICEIMAKGNFAGEKYGFCMQRKDFPKSNVQCK